MVGPDLSESWGGRRRPVALRPRCAPLTWIDRERFTDDTAEELKLTKIGDIEA
jgi:hypothetical protein